MKKKLSLFFLIASLIGCAEQIEEPTLKGIEISKKILELEIKETETLSILTDPVDIKIDRVFWISSNSAVATVSEEGLVTALLKGDVTITASVEGFKAECTIKVVAIPASKVTLDKSSLEIMQHKTKKLTATVLPEDSENKKNIWSSSDEAIAMVSEDGEVTAVTVGEATITVTSSSNSDIKDECVVTVIPIAVVPISIDNLTPTTFIASFGIKLGTYDGVAYRIYNSDYYYPERLVEDIEQGYAKLTEEDITINEGAYGVLDANQEYTIAYVAVEKDSDDNYSKIVGDVKVMEFTTQDYVFGKGTSSVSISLEPSGITTSGVSYTTTRSKNCIATYSGIVKTADLAGSSLNEYLNADWFRYNYVNPFYSYGTFDYLETMELSQRNLIEDTEYTLFTVGITNNGYLGEIVSEEITTKQVIYNPNYKVDLTITPDLMSTLLNFSFGESVVKAYILNSKKTTETEDEAIAELLGRIEIGQAKPYLASGEYTLKFLTYNTPYKIYVISEGSDGVYGMAQVFEYSTKLAMFNSTASLTYTETSTVSGNRTEIIFEATLTNGAVGYYVKSISSGNLEDGGDGNMSADDYGHSFIKDSGLYESNYHTTGPVTITTYSKDDVVVFIPIDVNGKYGKAIAHAN